MGLYLGESQVQPDTNDPFTHKLILITYEHT